MPRSSLNRFFLSIVMPSILAIGLFILTIFLVILPSLERNIMNGKKEMISELGNSVCSLIEEYHQENISGRISTDSARALAIERVRQIHYGDDLKDYFWIIDLKPVMIMHPYRPELNGTELNNYRDPEGKALFLEAVNTVNESGEGYIDYMWQWKDDSTRIVPKLSYVKKYEPWGWIIGTGIYLEDVRLEIDSMRKRLMRISLIISLVISAILLFIVRQSLGIEQKRKKAEKNLKLSREKYKSLVEASTQGTLMYSGGSFIFSNLRFSDLSGYDPSEIRELDFGSVFNISWKELEAEIKDPKKSISREAELHCKDGSSREVVISLSRIIYAEQLGYILIIKEVNPQMQYEREGGHLAGELQSSLQMMNRPLRSIAREPELCQSTTSIREAARLMSRKESDLLFISQEDQVIGLVTSEDLVTRGMAEELDQEDWIARIMTSPLLSLPGDTALYEGLLFMLKKNITHLAITNSQREITGVLSYRDFAGSQQNMLNFLLGDISLAVDVKQIRKIYKRLPVLVNALLDSGSNTEIITRIITSVADAIHRRLISLSLEELGPPPCKFAFMVLGSQGREEQTLATDQDNAIIFEDQKGESFQIAKDYFEILGKKLNLELDAVGYMLCPGDIMAGNRKWCQPLDIWKDHFNQWIRNSNPADILDAAIFFDFRCIYGKESLVEELRDHVNQASDSRSVFFFHMAQSVIKMKTHGSLSSGMLDLKKVLLPLTTYTRLHSIREKLSETNSLKRAMLLLEREGIDRDTFTELSYAFKYLNRIRIMNQANSIARNEAPGNLLNPDSLNRIEITVLKKILSDISGLQTRLSTEFHSAE